MPHLCPVRGSHRPSVTAISSAAAVARCLASDTIADRSGSASTSAAAARFSARLGQHVVEAVELIRRSGKVSVRIVHDRLRMAYRHRGDAGAEAVERLHHPHQPPLGGLEVTAKNLVLRHFEAVEAQMR